ncbi:head-tail connector protein [Tissierella carlieri]|uniref:Head-tail connector protein n=1 Tax=Tissierella carlieri TaxID=689904 RepID=A0ABT1S766_9FIRM|nr:head-tail connector protein [Tissierella carlieri]MCQ4922192.1 head-tail connector protein [Tissierella carlieri]
MVVTLEEAKLYLRVDGNEEDTLITSFILTAEEICEDILRFPLAEFEEVPKIVKQAILYCIANMYEKREGTYYYLKNESGSITETINVMKLILGSLRKESW